MSDFLKNPLSLFDIKGKTAIIDDWHTAMVLAPMSCWRQARRMN